MSTESIDLDLTGGDGIIRGNAGDVHTLVLSSEAITVGGTYTAHQVAHRSNETTPITVDTSTLAVDGKIRLNFTITRGRLLVRRLAPQRTLLDVFLIEGT